jgi:hypothetical protein
VLGEAEAVEDGGGLVGGAVVLLLTGEMPLVLVGRLPLADDWPFVHDAVVVTVTVTSVLGVQAGHTVVVVSDVIVNVSVMSDAVAHSIPVVDDAGGSADEDGGSVDDTGGSEDVAGGSTDVDAVELAEDDGSADMVDGEPVRVSVVGP